MSLRVSGVAAWALLFVLAAAPLAGAQGRSSKCFGAASRDPDRPCTNKGLNFVAIPSPFAAVLEPSAPCAPIPGSVPDACTFGSAGARSGVALMGDSHSTHWRAALDVVARARRWRGYSINRNNCPFTFARTPGKGGCAGWAQRVVRWLRRHPEVRTVVVSANSGSGVIPRRGRTRGETKVDGYIRAWKAIPGTVRNIHVIRDVPHNRVNTNDCVAAAVARHRNPAVRCARPRGAALRKDLAAVAAEETNSTRVKLIDLSSYMCDEKQCFPVVGGALVIKDIGHLTRTFSTTMGPPLGRAIRRLED